MSLLKKLRPILLFILIIGAVRPTYGQEAVTNPYENQKPPSRIVLDGIVGFQFGSINFIEVSPTIGYKLTRNFMPGIGLTFQYSEYKDYFLNTQTNLLSSRKNNTMGIRFFGRYFIPAFSEILHGNLFLHAEYEYLSYSLDYKINANGIYVDPFGYPYSKGNEVVNVTGILVGGGLNQPIGGRMFANIFLLYNLNHTKETPYSNPVIRVGFGVGL